MKFSKSIVSSVVIASAALLPCTSSAYQAAPEYQREEVKLTQGSLADISKQAGFAVRIPKSAEMYYGYKDIKQLVEGFINSKLGKAIDKNLEEEDRMSSAIKSGSYRDFMMVAGEEMFFAGGEGISSFFEMYIAASMEINKSSIQMYMRLLSSDLDMDDEEQMREMSKMPEFFTNRDGALKMLKEVKIAPMYAGFKVSDANMRAELLKVLNAALQQPVMETPEMFKTIKSDVMNGFTGFKLNGKDAVKELEKQGMEEFFVEELGKELLEEYKQEIGKRELVCLVGEVDDYIVFFAGDSLDDLKIAQNPEESLLANPEATFARNYADKDVKGLFFMSKGLVESFSKMNGTISTYTSLIVDALKNTDKFGDTREVQDLLLEVAKKEMTLMSMMAKSRIGAVVYREDGYKIDSYLGSEYPSLDLDSPRKLAAMASHPDAVISGSWISNEKYSDVTLELLETLFKAVYKGTQIAVEQDFHDDEWIEFAAMFKMIDSTYSNDLLRVWNALKSGSEGLDNETAFMVDLKGRLPRIPKAPSVILDNGPVPRIAYARNVIDRSKLTASWSEISAAAKNIATGVSKMTEQKIELPKPERMKQGGLDIWSYQLGITNKDANLALGLNDQLFYLTTSPSYIAERASEKMEKGAVPCAEMLIRVAPMRTAAQAWMKLLDESGQDFISEQEWEDYQDLKPFYKDFLEASKDMEKIDIFTRKIGGEVRNTIHFDFK